MTTPTRATTALGRLGRAVGVVAVFSVVAPMLIAGIFALFVIVLGTPILELLFFWIDWRAWRTIALILLTLVVLVAAAPPSFMVGLAFAIASVYFRASSLFVAIVIVAVAAAGMVALGTFMTPPESSPMMLPSVSDIRQGAAMWLFLTLPGALAAAVCWLVSRPLHRSS